MFNWLGKLDEKWSKVIIAGGLVFVILAGVFGTGVIANLKQGGFEDKNSESYHVTQALQDKLGNQVSLVVLFNSKDKQVDDPAYAKQVAEVLDKLKKDDSVSSVTSYYSTKASQLVSYDKKSTYAAVTLKGSVDEQAKAFKDLKPKLKSDQLQVRLGGDVAIQQEISDQVSKDLEKAESITFPLLAILLVVVFRSLVAAFLPLLLGGVTILGAFLVLRLISVFMDLSVFALNIITVLGLGLSIDYSLFMVSRFREELRKSKGNKAQALETTLRTAGRTVFFSGMTVMISLLGLLVFPLNFLKSMGLGGSAAVLVAMVTALTLLPAILYLLGSRVNALSFGSAKRDNEAMKAGKLKDTKPGTTFWYHLPKFVMRNAVAVIIVTVVALVLVGLPFLNAKFNTPDYRSLPVKSEGRVVTETLKQNFPGIADPIQIMVKTEGNALDPNNVGALYEYVQKLKAVPGITSAESLVSVAPGLSKDQYQAFYLKSSDPQVAGAAAQYAKGDYTLINLGYKPSSDSKDAQQIVKDVRAVQPPAGLQADVGGITAQLVDLLRVLRHFIPYGLLLIVLTLFVLLFLMLGSVLIPIKSVIMNILSLSASFGAIVWVFQEGHLAGPLNFTSQGSIDATNPILIFAIAFGLSMDYAVFLLSRIKEQYDKTGKTDEAVALGVEKTAAIITSAALLLIVVVAAFASGEIPLMKQIGVGLALAIVMDALVIRMLLVPATMHLLGKYNWWAPAPLKRLHDRLGLAEH
jgi:uncharacterized membrane protein YdfJ with MMPL/SSD domain